jgi:hypothetical protein
MGSGSLRATRKFCGVVAATSPIARAAGPVQIDVLLISQDLPFLSSVRASPLALQGAMIFP